MRRAILVRGAGCLAEVVVRVGDVVGGGAAGCAGGGVRVPLATQDSLAGRWSALPRGIRPAGFR